MKMGQNSSLSKPGHRNSIRYPFPRRNKTHQTTLSHTFTVYDCNEKVEMLNINTASEEELMTLPGVNRDIAKSIVEHRKAIGRYKKIEDLALVPGIGADKLEQMRPEICVTKKKALSCASSRTQSFDSLRSVDSRSTIKSSRMVNINRANVFELQCVHGITQEIAAGIVYYRNKKGPFKHVEDLIKVKSIDRMRLGNISQFLTAEESPELITSNGTIPSASLNRRCNGVPPNGGGPLKFPNGISDSALTNIFELLSAYSPRPLSEERFYYSRCRERCIRVAFWNLHDFTFEKASNLGVREVICRTVLENGWSILAVQDVVDVSALQLICDELNKPKLRRVAEWAENSKDWSFSMFDVKNSRLGFLYDTYSGGIDVELTSITQGPVDLKDECEVVIGTFRVRDVCMHLINTKIGSAASVTTVDEKLKEFISNDDIVLLLGDFSGVSDETNEWMQIGGLQPILPEHLSSVSENNISNILGSTKAHTHLTGLWGVVRQGLTHLAIPSGWSWGGPVSPYCPMWTEVFVTFTSGTLL